MYDSLLLLVCPKPCLLDLDFSIKSHKYNWGKSLSRITATKIQIVNFSNSEQQQSLLIATNTNNFLFFFSKIYLYFFIFFFRIRIFAKQIFVISCNVSSFFFFSSDYSKNLRDLNLTNLHNILIHQSRSISHVSNFLFFFFHYSLFIFYPIFFHHNIQSTSPFPFFSFLFFVASFFQLIHLLMT